MFTEIWVYCIVCVVFARLGFKLKALRMLGKYSTIELHPPLPDSRRKEMLSR